jgi:hypothetical protein
VREEAEARVEALRSIIAPALERVSAPGLRDMQAKHDGVRRSVEDLARLGVPVPEALTALLGELHEELSLVDESRDALEYLRSALTDVLSDIDAALPDEPSKAITVRNRAPKSAPRGFILSGTEYAATKWIDVLREVTRIMGERHSDQVDRLLTLRGRTRAYFSRDQSELTRPELIPQTDIYLDAQRYPDQIIDLCPEIVKLFGYRSDEFAIVESD